MHPHELGRAGEKMAEKLLKEKGYIILERNWRVGRTEIDIIARDGDFLVIVEVKTRSGSGYGSPGEAVNARKMEDLAGAAAVYQEMKNLDLEYRFDIVSIVISPGHDHIHHLADAFHL